MDGLECSEVNIKEVFDNKDFRIDTDFYTKKPFKNPNLCYERIGNILDYAQYGVSIAMNEDGNGYPIYRMNEIHDMLCDIHIDKCAELSPVEFNRFKLQSGDVLFNRTNSYEWVGRTGVYYQNGDELCTFASYLVRFIPNKNIVLSEYLATYLNTKFGVWDVKRRARQSINQTNVNPEEVKEIEIPLLSLTFQKILQTLFLKANDLRIESTYLYSQAEQIMLNELDLADFVPSDEQLSVKNFSESFGTSGRLDAEYYQTKYDEYYSLITKYQYGSDRLSNVCSQKDKNFKPKDKVSYRYIELSNIGASGDVTGYTIETGENLPSRARRIVQANDVIVSSVEGSLQSCALIKETDSGSICSTGFYILNSKKINSETLLVLFKSEPIQNLLKKGCSGTILTAISKDEFASLQIPLIDLDIQNTIAEKIQESFKLRSESKALLEKAKKAVEIAIEQDETAAMHFLDK